MQVSLGARCANYVVGKLAKYTNMPLVVKKGNSWRNLRTDTLVVSDAANKTIYVGEGNRINNQLGITYIRVPKNNGECALCHSSGHLEYIPKEKLGEAVQRWQIFINRFKISHPKASQKEIIKALNERKDTYFHLIKS